MERGTIWPAEQADETFSTGADDPVSLRKTPTYVTQPPMPPLHEFIPYLETIWREKRLTNAGPLHEQLETELERYLGVDHLALVANGTIALTLALKALDLEGEIITTPFSFVATSNAIVASGLRPVFADIDPVTCNLDADAVEAAITPRTTAIMPVHCFGRPCDLERLQAIADRHALPIIYDAAHAFGVRQGGGSILRHGTVSTLSFHATKVFSTFEGGAIVCRDKALKDRITSLRNFGFIDQDRVASIGINGKMSEIHAAFGLLQLKHLDRAIERRRQISMRYRRGLAETVGISIVPVDEDTVANYGYFPILVEDRYPLDRDALHAMLMDRGICARRYFYPLITDMPAYQGAPGAQGEYPNARHVADAILCLPIYPDLADATIDTVIDTIAEVAARRSAA
jgi:dTDP-4-amino-4,6-dideoxygalactose transaminase